jgi:hypothetical protein
VDRTEAELISDAIRTSLISPNVPDSNHEPANLVDTASYIAYGVEGGARVLHEVAEVLHDVAAALRDRDVRKE